MAYDKNLEQVVGQNEVPDVVMKDEDTGKTVPHPDAWGATIVQLVSYNGKTPDIQLQRKIYAKNGKEEKTVPFIKFPHDSAERIAQTIIAAAKKIESNL